MMGCMLILRRLGVGLVWLLEELLWTIDDAECIDAWIIARLFSYYLGAFFL
jgi:hypothetical protein